MPCLYTRDWSAVMRMRSTGTGHAGGAVRSGPGRSERQPQKEVFTHEPIAGGPNIYFHSVRRAPT